MKKSLLSLVVGLPLMASSVTVQSSYAKALGYEAKVQSYGYQIQAKEQEIEQAKSRLYPQIRLVTSATQRDYTINNNRGTKRDESYYTVQLAGDLPIYHPENFNSIDQAKLKYRFSDFYMMQLKQDLAFDVTDAFMLIVRAKNSLFVARAYLDSSKASYNRLEKMYSKSLSNKMDLLSSKVTYERSKVRVNKEKQNLRLAKYKFKILTSIDDVDISKINLGKTDISKLTILTKREQLNGMNLEIKKSNINIDLTNKQIDNSYYGHYPKVDLSASISTYDTENSFTDYEDESRVMLNMKLPLYQGGYVESDISKYRYLLSAAHEDLKNIQREILSQYEELTINLQTSKENTALYKEAIDSAKLNLHAVEKGYEHGLNNLIDVESAKVKLFQSQFDLIDSVYEYIKSYTSLLNLFGSLSSQRLKEIDSVLFEK